MVVLVAPSTQRVPNGTTEPANVVYRGALNTGDVLTFGFASASADPGVTQPTFDLDLYDAYPGTRLINRDTGWTETNVQVSYTASGPRTFALVLQGGGQPAGARHGTCFGYHAENSQASLVYCAYGTEMRPGVDLVLYLTPQLVQQMLQEVGMPWLLATLAPIYYTTLAVQDLCASGPPPLPTIDLSTVQASVTTVIAILRAIAWPHLCQCKAGAPAPVPYPPPSAPQPTGWPAPPVFTCDGLDLCSTLIAMQQQLAVMAVELTSTRVLTTLLQRYSLPFAYIVGATHSAIAASGSFAISRLVGVRIHVRQWPSSNEVFGGEPPYISDLGWLSCLTPDGLIDEVRLTRQDQTWLPRLMPTATTFGLSLRDGVIVDITELEAEP